MTITNKKRIEDITLANLQNGEVTLMQLNEIYNKFGFIFVAKEGKLKGIKKERVI